MAPTKQGSRPSKGKEIIVDLGEENPTKMVSEPGEGGTIPSPISDELSRIKQVQDHLISTMAELSNKFDLLLNSRLEDAGNCGNLDDREGIGTSHARDPMFGGDLGEHLQGNQRNRQHEGLERFVDGRIHQERARTEVPIQSAGGRLQSCRGGLHVAIGNQDRSMGGRYDAVGNQDQPRFGAGRVRQNAPEGYPHLAPMEDCLKGSKLSFPKFDGSKDPISWFSRAEKFFKLHNVHEDLQVELASFHLEEDAQIWFDMLQQNQELNSWEQLKDAMNLQFGPSDYEDFYGDLTRLIQDSSVQDYTVRFNRLATRAGHMT